MNHRVRVSFPRPHQQLHEQVQLDLVVKHSVYSYS
jgi:hypothetical protein